MSTPIRWSSELLVNSTTAGDQSSPTLAALADGRFVVAWEDWSTSAGDGSGCAVRAQLFNADGTELGAELLVNTTTANDQLEPNVAALADGGFVVAWTDQSASSVYAYDPNVRGQRFDADGTRSGTELLVNATTVGGQGWPRLTVLEDGRFVAVWTDASWSGGDTENGAVYGQVLNSDGTKLGAEFLVNTTVANDQGFPAIAALATDGRFVVAWEDWSQTGDDPSGSAIRAQALNADGTKFGGELLVNATTHAAQQSPALAALVDGRFVAVWTDWSETGGDVSGPAIRGQLFNGSGAKSGGEFLVNTTTAGCQDEPAVAGLPDGRFAVAWRDGSGSAGDTSSTAIRAQVFNPDGGASGSELLVNTTVNGEQDSPSIAVLADGRFVVAWDDASQSGGDASGTAIRAQLFDPRLAAVELVGSVYGDDYLGTIWNDTLRGGYGNDVLAGSAGSDYLYGEAGNDTLRGGIANDRLYAGVGNDSIGGGAGSDELYGGVGSDTLYGGASGDALIGGAGDDVYGIDSLTDLVIEAAGGGADKVQSSVSHVLAANVENLTLTGTAPLTGAGNALKNLITGNGSNNQLDGYAGNDTLAGASGADSLHGGTGADSLAGGSGNDGLFGGAGNDVLEGGAGRDNFTFDSALDASANLDRITDFSPVDDSIRLDDAVFTTLAVGALPIGLFHAGPGVVAALERDDRILYDTSTGALYYDADGTATAASPIRFATLTGTPAVSHLDFVVT